VGVDVDADKIHCSNNWKLKKTRGGGEVKVYSQHPFCFLNDYVKIWRVYRFNIKYLQVEPLTFKKRRIKHHHQTIQRLLCDSVNERKNFVRATASSAALSFEGPTDSVLKKLEAKLNRRTRCFGK